MATRPARNIAAPKPGQPIPAIQVISRAPNPEFRRGGQVWFHEQRTVALTEFTEEQLQAVRDEPLLVVSDTELPAEAEPQA